MKFKSIVLLSAFAAVNVYATPWKVEPVIDHDSAVVGYTYYAESTGTQSNTGTAEHKTRLKFRCSVDAPFTPELTIEWPGMYGTANPHVTISVDNSVPITSRWLQTNYNLARGVSLVAPLIFSMKTGKTLTAKWTTNDYIQRSTTFHIDMMNLDLPKFNRLCKTNI